MTTDYILARLCEYDKRNPDNCFDGEEIAFHEEQVKKDKGVCFCDNCFYGRTPLAEELLKYINNKK